jgi:hypothetical protein
MIQRRWLILPSLVFLGLFGIGVDFLIQPTPCVTQEDTQTATVLAANLAIILHAQFVPYSGRNE